jgi:hypothetical protein
MQAIKVENFTRAHSLPFPRVRSLSETECLTQLENICKSFSITVDGVDVGLLVLQAMERLSINVEANPCDDGFDLAALIAGLGIEPQEKVMINWDRFATIDELKFSDLRRFFSDIWYPSTDDIEIFDASAQWFIQVRHWCSINFGSAKVG